MKHLLAVMLFVPMFTGWVYVVQAGKQHLDHKTVEIALCSK